MLCLHTHTQTHKESCAWLLCVEAINTAETACQQRKRVQKKKKKKIRDVSNNHHPEALLACSKPVCMRRKSRSLHSQAFSCLSRSDPSRSPGPSLPTWAWSSDTRCSASCTKVAKCTARPSRLTTEKDRRTERGREREINACKVFL